MNELYVQKFSFVFNNAIENNKQVCVCEKEIKTIIHSFFFSHSFLKID